MIVRTTSNRRSVLRDGCILTLVIVLGVCTGTVLAQGSLLNFDFSNLGQVHLHADGSAIQTNGGFVAPAGAPPSHHEPQMRHHEPQAHLMDQLRNPIQSHLGRNTL
jgi:hypothetical protein